LDADVPLCLANLALISPTLGTILLVLAILLSLCCGLMAHSAMRGQAVRFLSERELHRVTAAAAIAGLSSAVCGYLGLSPYIAPVESGLDGALQLNVVLAAQLALACCLPLLTGGIGLVMAATRFNDEQRSRLAVAGQIMADLFVWWLPKAPLGNGNGENGNGDQDFEIMMASGEEVEAEERAYIENILELGETTALEVMTPRTDVEALDVDWEPAKIIEVVAESRHSRFPVFEETIDNVLGVLHLRNLLEFVARNDDISTLDLRNLLLEPKFVPASKKVDDVLRELQKQKGHMAIVLDEYGGTAGILTIEDLLEEIVGEIQDEHDEESQIVHELSDGSMLISATMPLDDLNDLLETELEAEDVETLGGYITHRLGRIPERNEQIADAAVRLTVLSVERNRIGMVKAERLDGEPVEHGERQA